MPTDKTIPRTRDAYDHFTRVTLRYSDQDPMQHINNVAITAMLESGRMTFLGHVLGDAMKDQGMVLARLTVDYLNEIRFPDDVEVGGRMAKVGGRSLTTQYAVFQGETCCVVSESVNVFFDTATRKSAEPNADVVKRLEGWGR